MPRQTITLTEPNHAWLQARVDSGEYRTQTEAVNDALRRVRESERMMETDEQIAEIRAKLEKAEQSGITTMTPAEILDEAKARYRAKRDL